VKKVLECINVSNEIIRNISFELFEGDYISILGHNGSGKTTTLKTIIGFYKYEGEIKFYNRNFGYLFDEIPILQNVKVKEYIEFFESCYSRNNKYLRELLEINNFENRKLNEISKGERKRIAYYFCLIKNPDYLILDEPTVYLDNFTKEKIWNFIKNNFKTILFSTNDWIEAKNYSNKIIMLNKGKILTFDYKEILLKKLKYKYKIVIEIKNEIPKIQFGDFQIIKDGKIYIYISETSKLNLNFEYELRETGLEDIYIALKENYELLYS